MLDKRIRQRLRHIDSAERASSTPSSEGAREAAVARELDEQVARAAVRGALRPPPPPPPRGPLQELAPGRVVEREEGSLYLIEEHPARALPGIERSLAALEGLMGTLGREDDPLNPLRGRNVADLVLLDIETAGLSAAPVFLVGLLLWTDADPGSASLVQLMARDYAEERAVLAETARLLARRRVMMTYNGRSFDLPMLRERTVYHGLPQLPEPEHHFDLLKAVRARFRGRWRDCRLQTLELHLCGRERWGDIEGGDIPQAYHDFVKDGDAGRMKQVLEHNRLDLITMLQVLPALSSPDGDQDAQGKSG